MACDNRARSGGGHGELRLLTTAEASSCRSRHPTAPGYHLGMPHIGIPDPVVDLLPGVLLMFALVVLIRALSRGAGRDVRTPWLLSAVAAIILAKLL